MAETQENWEKEQKDEAQGDRSQSLPVYSMLTLYIGTLSKLGCQV